MNGARTIVRLETQIADVLVTADERALQALQADAELFAVVREAVVELYNVFRSRIELAYFVDYEDEHPTPQVVVTALPQLPFARAHALMDNVRDRWLLPNMNRAGGRFALDVHPIA